MNVLVALKSRDANGKCFLSDAEIIVAKTKYDAVDEYERKRGIVVKFSTNDKFTLDLPRGIVLCSFTRDEVFISPFELMNIINRD